MRRYFFDHILVTLDTPEQAGLWMKELGVSLPVLKLALRKAGPVLNDIRAELGLARVYVFPRDDRVMQRMLAHGDKV